MRSCAILVGTLLAVGGCSKIPVDSKLEATSKLIAERATIGMRFATIGGKYRRQLQRVLQTTPFHLIVTTSSRLLNEDEPRLRTIACNILYTHVKNRRQLLQKHIKEIPENAVVALIKGTAKIHGNLAFYAVRATVYTACLKKKYKELFTMLEQHPLSIVRAEGFGRLMTYGRLEVLDKIKEYAKSPEEYPALSALRAPLWMYDYSAIEKQTITRWLLPYFKGKDSTRAAIAARILFNKIRGPYQKMVLDHLENRADMIEKSRQIPPRALMTFLRGLRIHQQPLAIQNRYLALRTRLEKLSNR